jgi:hypothetical protein
MAVSLVSNQSTYAANMYLSATLSEYIEKMAFDQVFNSIPFFQWLFGANQEIAQTTLVQDQVAASGILDLRSGGRDIDFPARIGQNTTVDSLEFYDLVDVTPQEGFTTLSVAWKMYGGSISVSLHEELLNANLEQRILDVVKEKTLQAMAELKDVLADHLYLGNNGSLTKSTDIHGMPYYVGTDPTSGTVATVDNSAVTWFRNQYNGTSQTITDTTPSFAANGLKYWYQMMLDCSAGQGTDEVDAIFTDKLTSTYAFLKLQPQQRYTETDKGDAGFRGRIWFMDTPVIWDGKAPSGRSYHLNSRTWKLIAHRDANMASTDFVEAQDQFARVAKVLWFGNLVCTEPRRNGVISGWTA